MTTATRSVAVVATRLPNIDRRALSQAWFSALHLAQPPCGGAPARGMATTSPCGVAVPLAAPSRAAADVRPKTAACASRRPAYAQKTPIGSALAERRGPAGELARRIERAIVRHGAVRPLHTAAIAINAGDGRVQLLVRTDGATTRIIALCAPHLRERVDRALAHARFALAAAGTRVEVAQ